MQSKPVKVGITGGIGAGKSIVCKVFKLLGTAIYDADQRAKELMQESPIVKQNIKDQFGHASYESSGKINRSFLAKEVFSDEKKLEILNGIVHPAVDLDFINWVSNHIDHKYILKEAALLVETGSFKRLDFLIVVSAPEEIRIKRILERDKHRTVKDIRAIISNQLAEEVKVEAADFVIKNDDNTLLLPQILKIHNFLLN